MSVHEDHSASKDDHLLGSALKSDIYSRLSTVKSEARDLWDCASGMATSGRRNKTSSVRNSKGKVAPEKRHYKEM